MFDAIVALFSLIIHAVLEALMWFATKVGTKTLKLLPLSEQAKGDKSDSKAFIIGSLMILISIAITWWFIVGLKN